MNESIVVEKFIGLPNLSLDLKPLTLLIGPQATGKSVVAKLFYFMKGFIWEVFTAIENDLSKNDLDQSLKSRFFDYFPSTCWGEGSFSVTYTSGSGKISIKKGKGKTGKLRISYPDFWSEQLELLKDEFRQKNQARNSSDDYQRFHLMDRIRNRLVKDATARYGNSVAFRQLFVPAGRSFFANLQSSIFSFLSSNNAMDPFLKEFGSVYENVKRWPDHFLQRDESLKEFTLRSKGLREKVLCGSYVSEKGKDYLDLLDGRRISLGNCSSGQQETLPLALILGALPVMSHFGSSIYIEEPEAHLFPTAQRSVLELIALTFNRGFPKLQALVTTHSPYILTALNNLLEAGRLYQMPLKHGAKNKLQTIIPKEHALSPSVVGAYSLSSSGIETITDAETGLIDASAIDAVSRDIAVQFDQLLDIEAS